MANFAQVTLLCRATRDPEAKSFSNGGKVTKLGVVVNNRKKQGAEWVDAPCFLDVEAFDRGEFGKNATNIEEKVRKGANLFIVGKLEQESWDDKVSGAKRTKIKVVLESFQLLDKKSEAALATAGEASSAGPDEGEDTPF